MKPRIIKGFTLVELMIALALGMLLVGACLAAFHSNSGTYSAGEAIGRMQENERIAFELMAKDIREAGGNPCDRAIPIYNVLNDPRARWYSDLSTMLRGYAKSNPFAGAAFGISQGQRLPDTAAIELKSAVSDSVQINRHDPATATIMLGLGGRFKAGQIVLACDFGQAAVFQLTASSAGHAPSITHQVGGAEPGNCSARLGWSPDQRCSGDGTYHAFGCYLGQWNLESGCADVQPPDGNPDRWPALLAPIKATRWYLANNADGKQSLFRESLEVKNGAPQSRVDEVLANVSDLEFAYLKRGAENYVSAEALSPADWLANDIVAVRVALTVDSSHRVVGSVPKRILEHVVAIRANG